MVLVVTDIGKATVDAKQFGRDHINAQFLTNLTAETVQRFFAEFQSPADNFPQAGGYPPIIAPTTNEDPVGFLIQDTCTTRDDLPACPSLFDGNRSFCTYPYLTFSDVRPKEYREVATMHAFAANRLSVFPRPELRPSFPVVQGAVRGELPRLPLRQLILVRMGDELARQALLEAWLPVVEQEARRYARAGGPADELEAEGALALWEAALHYDPQRHRTAPERYVQNHIHRRVRRLYRELQGYQGPKLVPVEAMAVRAADEAGYAAVERTLDVAGALAELKPAERQQFEQYLGLALAGMGPDEAARALAVQQEETFAAAKKRLERIRRRVRERLSQ
jgi:hypothetical protein